ncbi:hypothetical protein JZ751_006946 [Albula glossodonta]|uniref:Secreted protein n=1 Tax=Albula glossodonta TaxID=121402 RepID=A0A8T2P237_9TELE|nr:hypothetical protein JZ751_006946 [Albula glossodonta]
MWPHQHLLASTSHITFFACVRAYAMCVYEHAPKRGKEKFIRDRRESEEERGCWSLFGPPQPRLKTPPLIRFASVTAAI